MAKNSVDTVTLYGNLGGDPKVHQLPETEGTRKVYDPVIDDVVEKPFTRKAREFRTFSLAVSSKQMKETRWHPCVDWNDVSRLFKKGDRVRLTGYFQLRTYEKDGETQRFRQFVVKSGGIERAKIRRDVED